MSLPAPDLTLYEPPVDAVELAARRRRGQRVLTALRVGLGLAMAATGWAFGAHTDGYYVVAQAALGLLVVATAIAIGRGRPWRGVLGFLAFACIFLPFVFEVRDTQIYCAVLLGKTTLLATAVSPDIFT